MLTCMSNGALSRQRQSGIVALIVLEIMKGAYLIELSLARIISCWMLILDTTMSV